MSGEHKQSDCNLARTHLIVVQWLFEICDEFMFSSRTLFQSVRFFDTFLTGEVCDPKDLQLVKSSNELKAKADLFEDTDDWPASARAMLNAIGIP